MKCGGIVSRVVITMKGATIQRWLAGPGARIGPLAATGGYWILKSDGGVDAFAAPWYGSLVGHIPAGQSVTGLAGE